MKRRKCSKLIFVSALVIAISIYLAVNTIYTYLVFNIEQQLQDNMVTIDNRMLCYTLSLSVIKEMIMRQKSVSEIIASFSDFGGL
jgi:hypothetical protein